MGPSASLKKVMKKEISAPVGKRILLVQNVAGVGIAMDYGLDGRV
jgi:hypothetical protein